MQSNTITTDFDWKPGSNTKLYIPLDEIYGIAEKSGSGTTITNYSVSMTTLNGVRCGYFNGSARIETNLSSYTNTSHTFSVWYLAVGTNTAGIINSNPCGIYAGDTLGVSDSKTAAYYTSWYSGTSWSIKSATTYNMGTWHHLCFSGGVLYVDGVQVGSNSGSYAGGYVYTIGGHTTNSSCTRQFLTGYMRYVIIENTTWSAAKVLEYYNKTKQKFGL